MDISFKVYSALSLQLDNFYLHMQTTLSIATLSCCWDYPYTFNFRHYNFLASKLLLNSFMGYIFLHWFSTVFIQFMFSFIAQEIVFLASCLCLENESSLHYLVLLRTVWIWCMYTLSSGITLWRMLGFVLTYQFTVPHGVNINFRLLFELLHSY